MCLVFLSFLTVVERIKNTVEDGMNYEISGEHSVLTQGIKELKVSTVLSPVCVLCYFTVSVHVRFT